MWKGHNLSPLKYTNDWLLDGCVLGVLLRSLGCIKVLLFFCGTQKVKFWIITQIFSIQERSNTLQASCEEQTGICALNHFPKLLRIEREILLCKKGLKEKSSYSDHEHLDRSCKSIAQTVQEYFSILSVYCFFQYTVILMSLFVCIK